MDVREVPVACVYYDRSGEELAFGHNETNLTLNVCRIIQ